MNEELYAIELKDRYDEAKKYVKRPNITGNLLDLKDAHNLDYDKLKIEVEKLGYKIELAKNIQIPFWQDEWNNEPIFVFYRESSDL